MKKPQVAIFSFLLFASFSHGQSISDALKTCGKTQNSLKRLVCYDRIVNDMDKYSGVNDLMNIPAPLTQSSKGAVAPAKSPSSDNTQPVGKDANVNPSDGFGLEHKQLYQETEDKIYANVSSVKKGPRGKHTFTLENGQVWQQITAENFKIKENQEVFIERGVLNSYMMGSDSFNKKTRVKRIK
jgi:hypothetical protein